MTDPFSLLEALLWEPSGGYFLLEEHLRRLERSAAYFRYPLDIGAVRRRLAEFAAGLPERPRKVRLEASFDGAIRLSEEDVRPSAAVRAALAVRPVDSSDEFLRHKTSRRAVYERALALHPEAQDVLLWNERGELTEACNANVVLEIDGRKFTPHHAAGLLPGTFRGYLLERGEIEEEILPVGAVAQASRLFLINSVRRWREMRLLAGTDGTSRGPRAGSM